MIFNVKPVATGNTIYIRADRSVDPPTAPIQRDGDIYTFTDNINDSIVVERNNITIDGAGYTLQGIGTGIDLCNRSNVTVKRTKITGFEYGIYLSYSSWNTISRNNLTKNIYGIFLSRSANNTLSDKNIERTYGVGTPLRGGIGINMQYSDNNVISRNNLEKNRWGVGLEGSLSNVLLHNNITGYGPGVTTLGGGVWLYFGGYHILSGNNIANNTWWGIILENTGRAEITKNQIVNNWWGIRGISGDVVYDNNFINNGPTSSGISVSSSSLILNNNFIKTPVEVKGSNNIFYHNNFLNSSVRVFTDKSNIWDDGYPSGGTIGVDILA